MLNSLNLLLLLFGLSILNAQSMTAEELIRKWKVADITQTIEAEKTYSDLKHNYNPNVYNQVVKEIQTHLNDNYNPRIAIRLEMYKMLKEISKSNLKLSKENEENLMEIFQQAALLKDKQILSELYSLFAENSNSSFENNLFYIIKTIEIQEEIGSEYFPKFYLRLYFAGVTHYNLSLYRESIDYTKKSLENLKSPIENLGIYVLNMDLIGSSYYRVNKIDSSIYYYKEIYNELWEYNQNYKNYKENFGQYNSPFFNVWLGISQGGIGRGLLANKKYEESIPYFEYNILQSRTYDQPNDLAKAQNLLAEAYTNLGDKKKSINLRQNAYYNAFKSNTVKEILPATIALEKHFKEIGQYDSAYYYSEKKHFYENQVNQVINQSKFLAVTNRLQHEKMEQAIAKAENKIHRQTNTRNIILISTALLLTLLLFLYYRYRKQQQIKILKLNQKKELAEQNYLDSQVKIKQANQLLGEFRERLKHNKNLLENIKIKDQKTEPDFSGLQSTTILTKDDWLNFLKQFNKVYPNYYYSLREVFPQLSPAEIRYLCLVKLNLRQNEIAAALGVSDSSVRVTWHRMRKKLEVEKTTNPEEFLRNFEKNKEFFL